MDIHKFEKGIDNVAKVVASMATIATFAGRKIVENNFDSQKYMTARAVYELGEKKESFTKWLEEAGEEDELIEMKEKLKKDKKEKEKGERWMKKFKEETREVRLDWSRK